MSGFSGSANQQNPVGILPANLQNYLGGPGSMPPGSQGGGFGGIGNLGRANYMPNTMRYGGVYSAQPYRAGGKSGGYDPNAMRTMDMVMGPNGQMINRHQEAALNAGFNPTQFGYNPRNPTPFGGGYSGRSGYGGRFGGGYNPFGGFGGYNPYGGFGGGYGFGGGFGGGYGFGGNPFGYTDYNRMMPGMGAPFGVQYNPFTPQAPWVAPPAPPLATQISNIIRSGGGGDGPRDGGVFGGDRGPFGSNFGDQGRTGGYGGGGVFGGDRGPFGGNFGDQGRSGGYGGHGPLGGDGPGGGPGGAGSASGGTGGDPKILCTTLNEMYGFGSFRNATWMKYAKKNPDKYLTLGYHKIFAPLARKMPSSPRLTKVLQRIVRQRTNRCRRELRGKAPTFEQRLYKWGIEPVLCGIGLLIDKGILKKYKFDG